MNYKNWPLTPFSRSLTWIHDAAFVLFPQYVQPKNQRYLEKNVRRWMRRSDVVVTISNQSAAELAQYAPESAAKMKLVSIGIDREIFYPKSAEEVRDVQKRYALTTPYLCFLSTIEPRKNLDTLISAFERLQAKKPDLSLLLIGGRGWLNEGILDHIERARQQGCKIITPDKYVPDEDLPALLSGAEILVHPSFHEGFGIAPLQAMACGTPVVASDIPVTREILQDACLYFDTTDESDLAKQIEKVLDDPILSSGLIKKGSERVNAYTWGAVIEQLKSLLK